MAVHRRVLARITGSVFGAAAVCFLVLKIAQHRDDVGAVLSDVRPGPLAVSFFWLLGCLAISVFGLRQILRLVGVRLPPGKVFTATFLPQLARYVPGKVWAILTYVFVLEREGVDRGAAIASGVLVFYYDLVSAVSVFLLCLAASQIAAVSSVPGILVMAAAVVPGCVLCHPGIIRRILVLALRRACPGCRITYRGSVGVFGLMMLEWAVYGIGFFHLAAALGHTETRQTLLVLGSSAVSWVAGNLALFFPAGLGAKEGVHVFLGGLFVPPGLVAGISVAERVWYTVGEGAAIGVCLLWGGIGALKGLGRWTRVR